MKLTFLRAIMILMILLLLLLFSSCQNPSDEVIDVTIKPHITHIRVGETVQFGLEAEFKKRAASGLVLFKDNRPEHYRAFMKASWRVFSDCGSIDQTGKFTALKPGKIVVVADWLDKERSFGIEIIKESPVPYLPYFTSHGTTPELNYCSLELIEPHSFYLTFSFQNLKQELRITEPDANKMLPWQFEKDDCIITVSSVIGKIVNGRVEFTGGGKIDFVVWKYGDGKFPISLQGKKVLMTGDSMVEGLAPHFKKRVNAAGGSFYGEPWYSSTTLLWQESKRLTELIEREKPDIVFIALGSNEIFIPQQAARAAAVRDITAEIGKLPGYWIGPPSWKPDQGIVDTIRTNFQPDHFYNSNYIFLPRRRDGAHPTPEGAKIWADKVWDWYVEQDQ